MTVELSDVEYSEFRRRSELLTDAENLIAALGAVLYNERPLDPFEVALTEQTYHHYMRDFVYPARQRLVNALASAH